MPLVAAKSTRPRAHRAAALACAFCASCSVNTDDLTFVPDQEFRGEGGASGTGGAMEAIAGVPSTVGGMSGGDSCSARLEGSARCSGSELQVCKSHSYSTLETCTDPGRCNALRQSCLDCTPGSFRCTGDTLEQCNLEGSAFELVQTCSKGGCVAEDDGGFCRVCEPGEALCESQERTFSSSGTPAGNRNRVHESLRVCNGQGSGTYQLEICDFRAPICDPAEQRCLLCSPGEALCNGSQLLTCNEDGLGTTLSADCGHPARCDAQEPGCRPATCVNPSGSASPQGTVLCRGASGTELSLCSASGMWELLDLCDSVESCEGGLEPRRCLDEADNYCVPGTSKCEGDELSICAPISEPESFGPSGARWHLYATCSEGCVVSESGVAECAEADGSLPYSDPVVCMPGSPETLDCSGDTCEPSSCDSGDLCGGTVWGCTSCIPDNARCEENVLVRCNSEGTGEDPVEDCAEGVCDRFRDACLPARPGERFCQDGTLLRVATDGTTQTLERCGSDQLCSAEAGCRVPACVIGSVVCGGEDGAELLGCPDGTELRRAAARCASADRCEDGIGCLSVLRVALGEAHSCALMVPEDPEMGELGFIKCWGANESGQLGNGARLLGDEPEPRPVVFQSTGTGTLSALARFRQSGLCAGRSFTCADAQIEEGSTVVCWGSNATGQLGIGAQLGSVTVANAVVGVVAPVTRNLDVAPRDGKPDPFLGLSSVTCGADFACALDPAGRAWCWGANDVGQLGSGRTSARPSTVAQQVEFETELALTKLAAGSRHVCGIDTSGRLWCWGGGARGQLGQGEPDPSAIPLQFEGATRGAALGRDFTLVQRARGAIHGFGNNFFGQLATGDSTTALAPVDAGELGQLDLELLFGGPLAAHACGLAGPSLYCWGANPLGQLGDGTTVDRYAPVVAIDKNLATLVGTSGTVALGKSHTCVVVDGSGGLFCWGGNQRKQLGSSVADAWTPTPTEMLTGSPGRKP